jgi:hypothetical protein
LVSHPKGRTQIGVQEQGDEKNMDLKGGNGRRLEKSA